MARLPKEVSRQVGRLEQNFQMFKIHSISTSFSSVMVRQASYDHQETSTSVLRYPHSICSSNGTICTHMKSVAQPAQFTLVVSPPLSRTRFTGNFPAQAKSAGTSPDNNGRHNTTAQVHLTFSYFIGYVEPYVCNLPEYLIVHRCNIYLNIFCTTYI